MEYSLLIVHDEIYVPFYALLVCVIITQAHEAQISQKRRIDLSEIDFHMKSYLKIFKLPSWDYSEYFLKTAAAIKH